LCGYLVLAERLYTEGQSYAEGWNFGPYDEDARPVLWIVERIVEAWGNGANWQLEGGEQPHEASCLKLDISRARSRLDWQPRWSLVTAIEKTIEWHHAWLDKADVHAMCQQQINEYQYTHI